LLSVVRLKSIYSTVLNHTQLVVYTSSFVAAAAAAPAVGRDAKHTNYTAKLQAAAL
jgi:hypothetical protein